MENSTYATLTRQSGLQAQMRVLANNIANAGTTGYRAEGVIFSEYVARLGDDAPSLSMAAARVRQTDTSQGALTQTDGAFDLAIEGEGFFAIETPEGQRLTRAGNFGPNENGDLVTPDGYPVLDAGGAPLFVPQGQGPVGIGADGTVSVEGRPVGQVGVFRPLDPLAVTRGSGVMFDAGGAVEAVPDPAVLQGYLEESNVDPVVEVARMIEVQRAYELGQGFLDKEDERIRSLIRAVSK
ncbi:flagellar hook-basal body complex protein [Pseudoroseicyclus aestuarii]|uniref:Flagellar basal-body rod protein FlgF n=1 Tax=Pseudoroseicyclus aestuarii TaxID=1795041 RepID=A0A318SRM5_9RHOB|nr:flagellar hook-basal body complex protein [Pseudoroseicyclus aestuarii]PYE84581.1 flagellar basal-body rod protein FlgF [Pseudoroseicyclus aestuarii]